MRATAAQDDSVHHIHAVDVADVLAYPAKKPQIFFALHS